MDLSGSRPQLLTDKLATGAHWLITMGCGEACPVVPGLQREDWPLPDPKGQPLERVRAIRDEIRARVEALLAREGWRLAGALGAVTLRLRSEGEARGRDSVADPNGYSDGSAREGEARIREVRRPKVSASAVRASHAFGRKPDEVSVQASVIVLVVVRRDRVGASMRRDKITDCLRAVRAHEHLGNRPLGMEERTGVREKRAHDATGVASQPGNGDNDMRLWRLRESEMRRAAYHRR